MTTHVRLEVTEGVAVLTLDGPEKLNAFSSTTARELGDAYRRCDQDEAVRVVVLTGAGRAFCSGADLAPGAGSFDLPGPDFSASPIRPPAWEVRKLVIAAINGPAIGIGFTTALQCDLRIAAADATLAVPQARLGMVGDAHSHLTARLVAGTAVAAELLLTGRSFTGAEALAKGLVNEAVPADQVLDRALAIARDVVENVRAESVALSKQILWSGLAFDEIERAETDAHRILMTD